MIGAVHIPLGQFTSVSPLTQGSPHAAARTPSATDKAQKAGTFQPSAGKGFTAKAASSHFALTPSDFAHAFSAVSQAPGATSASFGNAASSYARATLLTASSLQLYA